MKKQNIVSALGDYFVFPISLDDVINLALHLKGLIFDLNVCPKSYPYYRCWLHIPRSYSWDNSTFELIKTILSLANTHRIPVPQELDEVVEIHSYVERNSWDLWWECEDIETICVVLKALSKSVITKYIHIDAGDDYVRAKVDIQFRRFEVYGFKRRVYEREKYPSRSMIKKSKRVFRKLSEFEDYFEREERGIYRILL